MSSEQDTLVHSRCSLWKSRIVDASRYLGATIGGNEGWWCGDVFFVLFWKCLFCFRKISGLARPFLKDCVRMQLMARLQHLWTVFCQMITRRSWRICAIVSSTVQMLWIRKSGRASVQDVVGKNASRRHWNSERLLARSWGKRRVSVTCYAVACSMHVVDNRNGTVR